MSRQNRRQSALPGALIGLRGILIDEGATVPADGTPGYTPGALFIDTDATIGAQWWVNVGTALSAAFVNFDGALNAIALVTTKTVTANENGKTFYLNLAGGFTVTLPTAALGLRYRFIVKTAPTTSYVITAGSAILYGMMEERAGGAGVAGAAVTNFNFVANQAIIADWVEMFSDGTNWYYHGMVNVAAGNTVS